MKLYPKNNSNSNSRSYTIRIDSTDTNSIGSQEIQSVLSISLDPNQSDPELGLLEFSWFDLVFASRIKRSPKDRGGHNRTECKWNELNQSKWNPIDSIGSIEWINFSIDCDLEQVAIDTERLWGSQIYVLE